MDNNPGIYEYTIKNIIDALHIFEDENDYVVMIGTIDGMIKDL